MAARTGSRAGRCTVNQSLWIWLALLCIAVNADTIDQAGAHTSPVHLSDAHLPAHTSCTHTPAPPTSLYISRYACSRVCSSPTPPCAASSLYTSLCGTCPTHLPATCIGAVCAEPLSVHRIADVASVVAVYRVTVRQHNANSHCERVPAALHPVVSR